MALVQPFLAYDKATCDDLQNIYKPYLIKNNTKAINQLLKQKFHCF